ncbi:MAG: hypothetical protein AAGI50_15875 [Pseudomonadota bacterium]
MLIDLIRYGHILGLALGFGLAIYADLKLLRGLTRPISTAMITSLREVHGYVAVGLVGLWATGLMLIATKAAFGPAGLSDKLYVKVMLATLLTSNAVAIGRIALPMMAKAEGRLFSELALPARVTLCLLGGFSAASWVSLAALGTFQGFKVMPVDEILAILRWPFLGAAMGAVAIAVALPYLHMLHRSTKPLVLRTPVRA